MASKINKNKVIAAAQKCVQKGQYDRAIREYTKIVEEDPRDVRIWLKIGDLHAKKNATSEAVDTYSKVAEFYSEQGFYLKAVAVYKQILKIDGSLVEINLRLAELYKQLGLLSDAMQQYEQVSNYYHQAGRTKEALAALRQIVDLDPENVASRIKLAELYSKEALKEEAVEEFSKAADFLRAENRIDDFIKVAERLVFHSPENMEITRELAGIYLRKKDPRRALQKLQLAFKADPRDERTLEMLAEAFEGLGQIAKTASVLKELANIHAENGQETKQREVYQRILTISPGDEDALQALQKPQYGAPQPAYEEPPAFEEPAYEEPPAFEEPAYEEPAYEEPAYEEPAYEEPYAPEQGEPYYQEQAPREGPAYTYDPKADYQEQQPYQEPEGGYSHPDGYEPPAPAAYSDEHHYEAPEHLDEVDASDYEVYDAADVRQQSFGPSDFQAEVAKIITEADVYVKYGLQDKAIEHLLQVFERDPTNLEVHLKLKDLYVQMGRYKEAALELVILAQMYQDSDRSQAAHYLNDALELDPENNDARSLLNNLEGATEEPQYGDDLDDMEPIDLDAADIVEEIPIDSSDLIDASELTPVDDDEVRYATDPGDSWDDYSDQTTDRGRRALDDGQQAVIEVHGETTDTLGGGTPSAEVIPLGGQPHRIESQARAHEEEDEGRIEDDLEEAEFFLQQNLVSEARSILDEISSRAPNHPLVKAKVAELRALEASVASDPEPVDEEPTNLAQELASDFDDVGELDLSAEESNYSVEDVFEEFKRGSEAQASEEDSDTHYDLGIAYREMGLYDDAITEFKVAMRSREKEVLCHMMIGLCYMEKEMLSEAISQFKTGLYVEGITERETIALYFELGQAYEHLEDFREALYYFEKVAKKDSRFRNVESRIETIRSQLEASGASLVDNNDGGNPGHGGGGDIVSKVV